MMHNFSGTSTQEYGLERNEKGWRRNPTTFFVPDWATKYTPWAAILYEIFLVVILIMIYNKVK